MCLIDISRFLNLLSTDDLLKLVIYDPGIIGDVSPSSDLHNLESLGCGRDTERLTGPAARRKDAIDEGQSFRAPSAKYMNLTTSWPCLLLIPREPH